MIQDNQTLVFIDDSGRAVKYEGVICSSIEEASKLLHPDYWKEIAVGKMRILDNGIKLLHICDDTMLIKRNGSRYFIQIEEEETENEGVQIRFV